MSADDDDGDALFDGVKLAIAAFFVVLVLVLVVVGAPVVRSRGSSGGGMECGPTPAGAGCA